MRKIAAISAFSVLVALTGAAFAASLTGTWNGTTSQNQIGTHKPYGIRLFVVTKNHRQYTGGTYSANWYYAGTHTGGSCASGLSGGETSFGQRIPVAANGTFSVKNMNIGYHDRLTISGKFKNNKFSGQFVETYSQPHARKCSTGKVTFSGKKTSSSGP